MMRVRTIEGTTTALAPFDFAKTLDFLRGFPPTLGKLLVVGDGLYWAARVAERTVLFHVRNKGVATDEVLEYTLHIGEPGRTEGIEQDAVGCSAGCSAWTTTWASSMGLPKPIPSSLL